MRNVFICFMMVVSTAAYNQENLKHSLYGNWLGIDMYQDAESYDGKNFFLPNEEFIIIDHDKIKIYFYPYSKSDEFDITIESSKIKHKLGKKVLETEYHFTSKNADTLVFTMHFINKTFVKMYSRVTSINERMEVDFATLNELDKYGFNPSAVHHLFELDTFHTEQFKGFKKISSLGFEPYQYIQFLNDNEISINRGASTKMIRGYKVMSFTHNGKTERIKIFASEGTQSLAIIPVTLCQCDSIVLPYLTVDWADRIRKDMKENAYKYRN